MKNILLCMTLFFGFINTSFAEGGGDFVLVRTVENMPGIECNLEEDAGEKNDDGTMNPIIYECKVPKGTAGVTNMLGGIIRYFTFIAGLLGVMFIVYSGIMYSMGGAEQSLKDAAKKRIMQTLLGIILLLLSGYILQFIAPWVFK